MKLIAKLLGAVILTLFAVYHLAFLIMPSITIQNDAEVGISLASVTLPSSNLDFGAIDAGTENTLHYSLEQADGAYRYQLQLANGVALKGACGYVTNSEVNKRVIIRLTGDHRLVCL